MNKENKSAATPPYVEQLAEEALKRIYNSCAKENPDSYYTWDEIKSQMEYKEFKSAMVEMYQAGQSAVPRLPTDEEVNNWFTENIDYGCSASSAIYKFRLWLKGQSAVQDATPQEWKFKYFPNHGDEDGRGCFTICYSGKDEYGDDDFNDAILVAVDDTEEGAKEACNRLNNILQQEISTLRSELSAAQEENKRLREVCQLRPEVLWFAQQMERKLRANDHKPGWQGDSLGSLMKRIDQECAELYAVIKSPGYESRITDEAADVANFAMMIADNAKNQSNKRTPPESGEQTKD